jgi:hypothetical protein
VPYALIAFKDKARFVSVCRNLPGSKGLWWLEACLLCSVRCRFEARAHQQ